MLTRSIDHVSSYECSAIVLVLDVLIMMAFNPRDLFLFAVESVIYNLSEVFFTPSSQFQDSSHWRSLNLD